MLSNVRDIHRMTRDKQLSSFQPRNACEDLQSYTDISQFPLTVHSITVIRTNEAIIVAAFTTYTNIKDTAAILCSHVVTLPYLRRKYPRLPSRRWISRL